MSTAHAHLLSINFLAKIILRSLRMHVKICPLRSSLLEVITDQALH